MIELGADPRQHINAEPASSSPAAPNRTDNAAADPAEDRLRRLAVLW